MSRIIIDVREPFEFQTGHVPGAINIPPNELLSGAKALVDIAMDEEIILYCRSGARSNTAMYILRDLGYTNLKNGINKEHVMANL